ncbi:hypothetical protein ISN45_Aa01g024920 [Arabidopsis thaliana x Arabidopsis arenosa]|uniref:Uncharacterized protein n=1 Tax=Arabidopsis thaliana x Arabidopsis arenosa TaxID=1240361 RepID=A0A8T2C267_9BRAS|nr:hypothetical protein ISN45_Aa01g024920 [Arabidopsis thaliana x Arabidopsis arenosa]
MARDLRIERKKRFISLTFICMGNQYMRPNKQTLNHRLQTKVIYVIAKSVVNDFRRVFKSRQNIQQDDNGSKGTKPMMLFWRNKEKGKTESNGIYLY